MKQQLIIIGTAVILFVGGLFLMSGSKSEQETLTLEPYEPQTEQPSSSSEVIEAPDTIVVDVKGAVKLPGVYEVQSNLRVHHVIDLAGGLTQEAEEVGINLSQKLQDEMVIFVPTEGEVNEMLMPQTNNKISISSADLTQLQTLPGIGEAKAQAIITYREQAGPFKTIEDLTNVPGIGEKTVENFKDLIVP